MTPPSTRPEPFLPPEVDLRDFPFMPLDVQRLRDSDLASDESPDSCWAAVLLWCASWHQVPAGSIPDSDEWQAKQAGYKAQGKVAPAWRKVRAGALRGWVLCSDGRLYHAVIAEKARDAWRSKLKQRFATECARIKKHSQRHELPLPIPEFEEWIAAGCPQGQPLPVSGDKQPLSLGSPGSESSKGQGQGQGEGQRQGEKESASAPQGEPPLRAPDDSPPEANGQQPTPAGAVCRAMRRVRLQGVNPGDPRLLELLRQGATEDEFVGMAEEAVRGGKGFAWVLHVLAARRAEASVIRLVPAVPAPPWHESWAAVVNRGCELGLDAWDEVAASAGTGPSRDAYRRQVIAADAAQRQGATG